MRLLAAVLFVAVIASGVLVLARDDLHVSDTAPRLVSQPVERTAFTIDRHSAYPTISWISSRVLASALAVRSHSNAPMDWKASIWPIFRPFADAVNSLLSFDWLFMRAAATATDTHFLVADAACTTTAIATDTDCWSHTTGGAGGAGLPGSGNAARIDAGSGAGAFSLGGNMNVASWNMTGFTGTLNMGANTLTVNGNLTLAGTFNRDTSTIVFAANGSLSMTANNIDRSIYNLTINAGVTVTNTTNNAWVSNLLTVNGTLLGGSPNDPQLVLFASGEGAGDSDGDGEAEMLILGANGDIDTSGYLILRARGPSRTTYEIPGATYQHLGVQGGNLNVLYTINQRGNITTPSCGVYNECAVLISSEATGTPAANFVYNANGFNITAGGTLWLGDGTTTGITFNAGAATIEAYAINPAGDNVVVNWNTSAVTAHPSSLENPLCFYSTGNSIINFNSSTFTCYGQFRLGWTPAGNTSRADLGSATIYVRDDEGCNNCAGVGYPGEFNIVRATNYLIMGSATVLIEDRWTNNSTSTSWDVGTSTVQLWWDFANTAGSPTPYGHYFLGPTNLAEAEFYNLEVRAVGTGSNTIVSLNDSPPWGPVWVGNRLTVSDPDGGSTTLDMQNQNVRLSDADILIGSNATLTMGTADIVDVQLLEVEGTLSMNGISVTGTNRLTIQTDTGSIDITAWAAWTFSGEVPTDIRWTFDSASGTGIAVTVQIQNVGRDYLYELARAGAAVSDRNRDGTLQLTIGGGWSGGPWSMAITSAPLPPIESEERPTVGLPPHVFVLLGAVLLIYYSHLLRKRRRKV